MNDWKDDSQDQAGYEEPSGTGKVLLYFFAVVVLCAVSVGIGYLMGRRAAPPAAETATSNTPAPAAHAAAKPDAVREVAEASPAPAEEEKMPEKTTKPSAVPTKGAANPKPATKAPEMKTAQGIMVQVAAVTRQEDADTLASALRKKQYPVFVMPASGTDKFFHVQVGPFAELKDAEAMKTKLAADGYNAIVKK